MAKLNDRIITQIQSIDQRILRDKIESVNHQITICTTLIFASAIITVNLSNFFKIFWAIFAFATLFKMIYLSKQITSSKKQLTQLQDSSQEGAQND
jgi:Zn-dependent membrane protease YugP